MKADDDNAFELSGLVVKPKTGSKASPKPAHKKGEHFARITKRHVALLSTVKRPAVAWPLFSHLMIHSVVRASNQPFPLPVDYLTKELATGRDTLMRVLHDLVGVGLVKTSCAGRYGPPLVSISGITKIKRRTT